MRNFRDRQARDLDRKQVQLNQKLNRKQEDIINAALKLLDHDGLNNLSLRNLAKALDMHAPGLYWYFKNKELLVDFMAEAILNEAFSDLKPCDEDQNWQDWLQTTMLSLRQAMLSHSDGARVVAGAHMWPAVTLGKVFECSLQTLTDAGFNIQSARRITGTLIAYSFGAVIEEQSSPTPEEIVEASQHEMFLELPLTVKMMKDIHSSKVTPEEDFIAGLQFIIKGAEQLS